MKIFTITEASVDNGVLQVQNFLERTAAEVFWKDLLTEYLKDSDEVENFEFEDYIGDDDDPNKVAIQKIIEQAIKNHWTWTGDSAQVRLFETEIEMGEK